MEERDLVLRYIEICHLHLQRLEEAFAHVKHLYPFRAEMFPLKSYEELASLDMFTTRLSKLQDTMGSKLIPLFLRYVGETIEGITLIDMLNYLEKLFILDDTKNWKKLRDIRNILSHEYPDSYEMTAKTLNEAVDLYPYLISILDNIRKKI